MSQRLRALLVDPSLFTAPYDAALTEGLIEASVEPTWAVRPTRRGDREELSGEHVEAFFYRHVDELPLPARLRAVAKGVAHGAGLLGLVGRAFARKPDVVHFQWTVVPVLDALAMLLIRQRCPVVLTVHDTTPFNGERLSALQNLGFDWPMRIADRVIVHTQAGRETLSARGVAESKLAVVAHGPLSLRAARHQDASPRTDSRFTFVLFGELKHYKGIDLLVEAVALLPPELRADARFIVAGRARMDLEPIHARIAELELRDVIEIRPDRLTEEEMAELFAATDCFVFPYRQIDASGVYFLVKSLGKWLIATNVGIFAEDLAEGAEGTLVPKEDTQALAEAIARAVTERPAPKPSSAQSRWSAIGSRTREVYHDARERFRKKRGRRRSLLGLAALAAALALPAPAASAEMPPRAVPPVPATPVGLSPTSGYELIKNWDFTRLIRDRAALSREFHTRYIYAEGSLDHLNDEWSRYRDNQNHVFTKQGLALVARPVGGLRPGSVQSGMLRSRWSGRHGVFEIRMKVPRGRGLWPAFWLNPEDGKWPPEIDVVEIVNNGRDTTRRSFHFLHGAFAKTGRRFVSRLDANQAYEPGVDYAADFHVFSVEWTPDRVRHLVDGSLVIDREYAWRHDDGTDAGPAHVLVNLAVGGKWPGAPLEPAVFPAELVVEYIRVWQR